MAPGFDLFCSLYAWPFSLLSAANGARCLISGGRALPLAHAYGAECSLWVVRGSEYKGGSERRRVRFYYNVYSRGLVCTLNFTWHAVVWSQPVRDEPPYNLTSGVPIIESRGIRFRQAMHPRKDLGNIVNLRDAQSGHVDALWAGRVKVFVEMRSCPSPK